MTTSATRNENRLTDSDRTRAREAITEYITTRNNGVHPHERRYLIESGIESDTVTRIMHRAIGCTEHDLRDSELDELAAILATYRRNR
jgi:HD superfamily phosphodiesterase